MPSGSPIKLVQPAPTLFLTQQIRCPVSKITITIVNHGPSKFSTSCNNFAHLDDKVGANREVLAVNPPNDGFKSVENQDDGLGGVGDGTLPRLYNDYNFWWGGGVVCLHLKGSGKPLETYETVVDTRIIDMI